MFVWVAVGGVMSAVERLDVAGTRLLGAAVDTQAAAAATAAAADQPAASDGVAAAAASSGGSTDLQRRSLIFSRQPSRLSLEAGHIQQQQQQQQPRQNQQQEGGLAHLLSSAVQRVLPFHRTPGQAAKTTAALQQQQQPQVQLIQAVFPIISAVLLLPVLKNIAGFWLGVLQQLRSPGGCCCQQAESQGDKAAARWGCDIVCCQLRGWEGDGAVGTREED